MACRFKRKETIAQATRRIGRTRVQRAIEALESRTEAEDGIHRARKEIKKLRSLVRLVRDLLGRKAARRIRNELRLAAGELANLRDASVRIQTLQNLQTFPELRPAASGYMGRIELRLRSAWITEMRRAREGKLAAKVKRLLRKSEKTLRKAARSRGGGRAVRAGLRRTYREGRRALREAARNPSIVTFHEWRKRAKELGCQVRLLRRVCPGRIEPLANELAQLTDMLGDDHDLTLLRAHLLRLTNNSEEDRRASRLVRSAARRRGRKLRAAALELGARLYRERPREFGERIDGYWRSWRRGDAEASPRADGAIRADAIRSHLRPPSASRRRDDQASVVSRS